jgi:hypothetical protein
MLVSGFKFEKLEHRVIEATEKIELVYPSQKRFDKSTERLDKGVYWMLRYPR